ncbi:MAG: hypothetical protein ACOC0V_04365, partial [Oceanicaulis sp.]
MTRAAYRPDIRPATPLAIAFDAAPRLRAIMLGAGTVGGGVLERLPGGVEILGALARTERRIGETVATADADTLFALNPDLVIEALPGGALAETLLERAVVAGCHVITANKDVAARRPDLARRAEAAGKVFACSAAVGGGAPVLETAQRLTAAGATVLRVRGVLNGTSNFVLDRLARGELLSAAVK